MDKQKALKRGFRKTFTPAGERAADPAAMLASPLKTENLI